jgi:flagellar hook-associated protein 2
MGTSIFTGNSGFDVQKVIDGFTKIEGARVEKLSKQTVDVTTRMSTLATLMGQAKELENALADLSAGAPLGIVGRQPLNVDASVSETAPAGRYNVQVMALAQPAQGSTTVTGSPSGNFADANARVNVGEYAFTVNNKSYNFTLTAGATIADIADAIAATGAPVQAAVVNTGSGVKLSIVGTETGYSAAASTPALQMSLVPPAADPADPDAVQFSFSLTQAPTNALVKVNGVEISRSSNTIDDVIPGVTLTATNIGSSEVFEVGRDTSLIGDKVQNFVDAYNTLRRAVNNQVDVAGGTDTSQLLTNDPVVRRLSRQMNELLRLDGGSTSVRSLGDLGINISRTGTLEFNQGKLSATLIARPTAVTDFLTGDQGFATKAENLIATFSNPLSGALSKRTFELSDEVSKIEKEKLEAQRKVDLFRDRLVRQFAALQSVQSQMSGLTTFLKANDSAASKKD